MTCHENDTNHWWEVVDLVASRQSPVAVMLQLIIFTIAIHELTSSLCASIY